MGYKSWHHTAQVARAYTKQVCAYTLIKTVPPSLIANLFVEYRFNQL